MKRIIAFAASLLALAAISSCQKLEPTTLTGEECAYKISLTVSCTYGTSKYAVPAGVKVDVTTGSGIHVQKTTNDQGSFDVVLGCPKEGDKVTVSFTVKKDGSYYYASFTTANAISPNTAGTIKVNAVQSTMNFSNS